MAIHDISQNPELRVDARQSHPGAQVFGSDEVLIGTVTEVWALVPQFGYVAKSTFVVEDYGPVQGTAHLLEAAPGYLQILTTDSTAGYLYAPLHAVEQTRDELALVLRHDAASAAALFATRPDMPVRQ